MAKNPIDSEMDFEDSENYKGSSEGLTIKQIMLKQFQKCLDEGSKEMIGGGVTERIINGVPYFIPRQNQREIFINSVEQMRILAQPEIKKNEKKIKEHLEKFNNADRQLNLEYNRRLKSIKEKYAPGGDWDGSKQATQNRNLEINDLEEWFETEKVFIYKNYLLTALSFLLNIENYFEEQGFLAE